MVILFFLINQSYRSTRVAKQVLVGVLEKRHIEQASTIFGYCIEKDTRPEMAIK